MKGIRVGLNAGRTLEVTTRLLLCGWRYNVWSEWIILNTTKQRSATQLGTESGVNRLPTTRGEFTRRETAPLVVVEVVVVVL